MSDIQLLSDDSIYESEGGSAAATVGGQTTRQRPQSWVVAADSSTEGVGQLDKSFFRLRDRRSSQREVESLVATVPFGVRARRQSAVSQPVLSSQQLLVGGAASMGTVWNLDAWTEPVGDPTVGQYLYVAIRRDPVTHLREQLDRLRGLTSGWDGYDAQSPNALALERAENVLEASNLVGIIPSRLVASAEGGLAVYFSRPDRYADIECLNDGAIMAVTSDGHGEPHVWEVDSLDLRGAVETIRAFLA